MLKFNQRKLFFSFPQASFACKIPEKFEQMVNDFKKTLPTSENGEMPVRVRFAPSPTGNLHLGGLRTALYNYLFAKSQNGTLILRIEDTDKTREVEGSIEKLGSDLKWSGLSWQAGPHSEARDSQGGVGPYLQSERLEYYQTWIKDLVDSGDAYHCFCSKDRLKELKKAQ